MASSLKRTAVLSGLILYVFTFGIQGHTFATPTTQLVSKSPGGGQQTAGDYFSPSISQDGRYVLYAGSPAIVSPGNTGNSQIIMYDRQLNTTTVVSTNQQGQMATYASGAIMSANDRYIAFSGVFPGDYNSGNGNVYVKDLQTGTVTLASPHYTVDAPPFDGFLAGVEGISQDGRYVVFQSRSGQFIPGVPDGYDKIYIRDMVNNTFTLASTSANGDQANSTSFDASISNDGTYVLFGSVATNLIPDQVRPNGTKSFYLKNMITGEVKDVSDDPNGQYSVTSTATAVMSPDASHIVFQAFASDQAGVYNQKAFLKDLNTGQVSLVESGVNTTNIFALSADSQHVAYIDAGTGDSIAVQNVLLWNAADGSTVRATNASIPGQYPVYTHVTTEHSLSANGVLAFSSRETDLVPADTNGLSDVFIYGNPYDATPPVVTSQLLPSPNANGWNNTNVTVNWTATDPDSTTTTPSPTLVTAEGANQVITSGQACDPTNNCATGSVTVNIDKTPPTVSNVSLATDPIATGQTTALGASVTDSLSGVAKAEYFTGVDPGVGNGTPMAVNSGAATATVGGYTTAGMYTFFVRSQDSAGNWSQPISVTLDVYNPAGGYTAAHGFVTPNNAIDVLPAETGNNLKATLDYSVKYTSAQSTTPTGKAVFTWGSTCNNPHSNCFAVTTDTTVNPAIGTLNWLIVPGDNTATFQGTATLSQGAATIGTNYPIKISVTGATATTPGHYELQIYPIGSDPHSAAPLYHISEDLSGGSIVMH